MTDDFAPLFDAIRRVLPDSRFEPVTSLQVAAIQQKYPDVPDHYLSFLRRVGHGSLGDSYFAVYSGPCEPSDFFDSKTADVLAGIVFFGDDFAGWMVGFDTRNNWQIVGVDSGWPKPVRQKAQTVAEFIAERVADC
jgi:hypothetical protein